MSILDVAEVIGCVLVTFPLVIIAALLIAVILGYLGND